MAGFAPCVQALDLLEAYQTAIQHNEEYRARERLFHAAAMDADLARALVRPQLHYSFAWYRNTYDSDQSQLVYEGDAALDFSSCGSDVNCVIDLIKNVKYVEASADYESRESSLNLVQPIYDASRFAERDKLQTRVQKAEAGLQGFQQQFMVQLLDAYLQWLGAEDAVNASRQQLAAIGLQQQLAAKRHDLGVGGELDLFEAQATLDAEKARLSRAEGQLQRARAALELIVAKPVAGVQPLSMQLPVVMPEPASVAAWQALAVVNSAELAEQQADKQLAELDYAKARGAQLPRLQFAASYRESELDGGQGFYPAATTKGFGIELVVPLYQGGGLTASRKQAAYRAQAAEDAYQYRQRQVRAQVAESYYQLLADVSATQAMQQAVASAQQALQAAERAYQNGVGPLPVLLEVQKKYYQAEKEWRLSRYQYLSDYFRLRYLAGSLVIGDIQQLNDWMVEAERVEDGY